MPPLVKDQLLSESVALPDDAGTVYTKEIDLGISTQADAPTACEVLLTAPALTNTQLPDTTTVTYSLQGSNTSNFAAVTYLANSAIVQTGNAGAAASSYRFRLPSTCPRYIRAAATSADVGNANVGNCAASSMTLDLVF